MLFTPNRVGYSDLAIDIAEVHRIIIDAPEFQKFSAEVSDQVNTSFAMHRGAFESISEDTKPNKLSRLSVRICLLVSRARHFWTRTTCTSSS
jgi:hypothetical protein